MDSKDLPIGFTMELAMNKPAMERYAALSLQERNSVLQRARDARSKAEMRRLVDSLVEADCQKSPDGLF